MAPPPLVAVPQQARGPMVPLPSQRSGAVSPLALQPPHGPTHHRKPHAVVRVVPRREPIRHRPPDRVRRIRVEVAVAAVPHPTQPRPAHLHPAIQAAVPLHHPLPPQVVDPEAADHREVAAEAVDRDHRWLSAKTCFGHRQLPTLSL